MGQFHDFVLLVIIDAEEFECKLLFCQIALNNP